jgi:hypothetical protein
VQRVVESDTAREVLRNNGSKWVFPQYFVDIETEPDVGQAANEYCYLLCWKIERQEKWLTNVALSVAGTKPN